MFATEPLFHEEFIKRTIYLRCRASILLVIDRALEVLFNFPGDRGGPALGDKLFEKNIFDMHEAALTTIVKLFVVQKNSINQHCIFRPWHYGPLQSGIIWSYAGIRVRTSSVFIIYYSNTAGCLTVQNFLSIFSSRFIYFIYLSIYIK